MGLSICHWLIGSVHKALCLLWSLWYISRMQVTYSFSLAVLVTIPIPKRGVLPTTLFFSPKKFIMTQMKFWVQKEYLIDMILFMEQIAIQIHWRCRMFYRSYMLSQFFSSFIKLVFVGQLLCSRYHFRNSFTDEQGTCEAGRSQI